MGLEPAVQSHTSNEVSALLPSHHGWLKGGVIVGTFFSVQKRTEKCTKMSNGDYFLCSMLGIKLVLFFIFSCLVSPLLPKWALNKSCFIEVSRLGDCIMMMKLNEIMIYSDLKLQQSTFIMEWTLRNTVVCWHYELLMW